MNKNIRSTGDDSIDWNKIPETIEITKDKVEELKKKARYPGRPTDIELRRKGKGRGKVIGNYKWWPEETKMKVVALSAMGLPNGEIEKLTKVPEGTFKRWRTEPWWFELLERVRAEKDEELDSKLTKIVDKATDIVYDRLETGDYVLDSKTGELRTKPVNARDAAIVSAIVVDKRQLLRGKPTSRVERINTEQRLSNLAEEFRKFAKAKDISKEVEVLTDDRKES